MIALKKNLAMTNETETLARLRELNAKRYQGKNGKYYVESFSAYTPHGEAAIGWEWLIMSDDEESLMAQNLKECEANFFAAAPEMMQLLEAKIKECEELKVEKEAWLGNLKIDDLPPEGERTKLQEWQAAYAALFQRLNNLNKKEILEAEGFGFLNDT